MDIQCGRLTKDHAKEREIRYILTWYVSEAGQEDAADHHQGVGDEGEQEDECRKSLHMHRVDECRNLAHTHTHLRTPHTHDTHHT